MNSVTERSDNEPLLPEMTAKALEILSKEGTPFFLMVEGSQIDWEGHDNDVYGVWKEVVELDQAVKVALDFAKDHPDTLIIVTADHETGGLGLSTGSPMNLEMVRSYQKTTDWIIANSSTSSKLKENVKKFYGYELADNELKYVENSSNKIESLSEVISKKANMGWTTHDHTGALVPILAFGSGSEEFTGIMDNTEFPKKIAYLLEVTFPDLIQIVPQN
jgi:alkaline phosphatase